MSSDSDVVRLEERLRGMAASTAILNETAKGERQQLAKSLEARRQEIQNLEKSLVEKADKEKIAQLEAEIADLKRQHASQAQVKAAIIGATGAILAACVALLRTFLGG